MDKTESYIKNRKKESSQSIYVVDLLQEPIALMKQANTIGKFRELKKNLVTIRDADKTVFELTDYLRLTFPRLKDLDAFCENFLHQHRGTYRPRTRLGEPHHLWVNETSDFLIFDKSAPMTTKLVFNHLVKDAELELLLEDKEYGRSFQIFFIPMKMFVKRL